MTWVPDPSEILTLFCYCWRLILCSCYFHVFFHFFFYFLISMSTHNHWCLDKNCPNIFWPIFWSPGERFWPKKEVISGSSAVLLLMLSLILGLGVGDCWQLFYRLIDASGNVFAKDCLLVGREHHSVGCSPFVCHNDKVVKKEQIFHQTRLIQRDQAGSDRTRPYQIRPNQTRP